MPWKATSMEAHGGLWPVMVMEANDLHGSMAMTSRGSPRARRSMATTMEGGPWPWSPWLWRVWRSGHGDMAVAFHGLGHGPPWCFFFFFFWLLFY
jgi:hypothetical protein